MNLRGLDKLPPRSDEALLDGLVVTTFIVDAMNDLPTGAGVTGVTWTTDQAREAQNRMARALIAHARLKQDELATHRHNVMCLAAKLGLPQTATWGEIFKVLDSVMARLP